MIVTSHQKGWKIINQRSHGLLAAMLAYQYDINLPNDVIVPTLIAIAEHDDGIKETEFENNLTEAGAPRHFMVSDSSKKPDFTQWENVMEIAGSKSQLNALLTSMHIDFIAGLGEGKKDKKLALFLRDQKQNRADILRHLDIDGKYAEWLYRFVEWCDAFSLLICMDSIQPEGRKMEISESPDGDMSQTFYKDENVITVFPWVFKKDSFNVFYEYKVLEQLKFSSVKQFNEACNSSLVYRKEFIVSK